MKNYPINRICVQSLYDQMINNRLDIFMKVRLIFTYRKGWGG